MLPFIPPEIIRKIIQFSTLDFTRFNCRQRYTDLLAYSLVDRTWRTLAQAELFESVMVQDEEKTRRLFAALEGTTGLGDSIRYLRFGWSVEAAFKSEDAPAEGLWASVSGVVEVQVHNATLRFERLCGQSNTLRRLHLQSIRCPSPPPPPMIFPTFSHLEHLSLVDIRVYSNEAWGLAICPLIFPALRSILLAVTRDGHLVGGAKRGFFKALASIGPQILSLAIIDTTRSHALEWHVLPCLSHFKSLESFVLLGQLVDSNVEYDSTRRPDIIAVLPKSLRSLTIISHPLLPPRWPIILHPLLASLRSNPPSLRKIKRISIPPPYSAETWMTRGISESRSVDGSSEDDSMRAELRSFAAAGEFVLDETGATPGVEAWLPFWLDFYQGISR